eukprot:CAMPEP_0174890258 /NCGR_PEP_ID=MMETSP0167-20121228/5427_1 /TAXON_ID=38298 /ORGANISM="Rhodella maculata, Strain CCMP736" /LENGTH=77 /DNA_ID=CAMNT_0016128005 /DNA_START=142 /DNA_END=375 /DNA_ORIENTATION=-
MQDADLVDELRAGLVVPDGRVLIRARVHLAEPPLVVLGLCSIFSHASATGDLGADEMNGKRKVGGQSQKEEEYSFKW